MGSSARNEWIVKIVTTTIGSILTIGFSMYAIKKLTDAMDPTRKEKEENKKKAELLMKSIGVTDIKLTEYELCMAANLIDTSKLNTEWTDIGGLNNVVNDIRESIIEPFMHPGLYSSPLCQPPKGVLLYGPPGCGKTMIAKATAKAAGARFLNIQISSMFDKWYGESQKRTEAIFSLAMKIQPTIVFIDEIDSFLRERSSSDHEATSMMKTQFMTLWDGLSTSSCSTTHPRVVIVAATNRPQDVDPAILRRMPAMFHIALPDRDQRKQILNVILKDESVSVDVDWDKILSGTNGWSGSDLKELCRQVMQSKVQEAIRKGSKGGVGVLEGVDFEKGLEKMSHFKKVSNNSFSSSIGI